MITQDSPVMLARGGLRNRDLGQYYLRDVEAITSGGGQTIAYLHYGKTVFVHALRKGDSTLYENGRRLTTQAIEAWTRSQKDLGMRFIRCGRGILVNDLHFKEYRHRNHDLGFDNCDGITLTSGATKPVRRRLAPAIKAIFKQGIPAVGLGAAMASHAGDIEPILPIPTPPKPTPVSAPTQERAIAALRMHELLGSAASIGLPVTPIFNPYAAPSEQKDVTDVAFDWRTVVPGHFIP